MDDVLEALDLDAELVVFEREGVGELFHLVEFLVEALAVLDHVVGYGFAEFARVGRVPDLAGM